MTPTGTNTEQLNWPQIPQFSPADDGILGQDIEIQRSDDGGKHFYYVANVNAADTQFNDGEGNDPGYDYFFRIRIRTWADDGISIYSYSPWSVVASAETYCAPLNWGVTVTPGATELDISWIDDNEAETGTVYQLATDNAFTDLVSIGGNSYGTVGPDVTSASITGLSPATTYYLRIEALPNGTDPSDWTVVQTATLALTSVSVSTVLDAAELGPDGQPSDGYFEFSQSGVSSNGELIFPETVVNYTVDTSADDAATPGDEYEALPGSVTIPAGASNVLVPIVPKEIDSAEGNTTVTVDVSSSATYSSGSSSATANVVNTDDATITVASDTLVVGELGQTVAVVAIGHYGRPDESELFVSSSNTTDIDPTVAEVAPDASGRAVVPVDALALGSAALTCDDADGAAGEGEESDFRETAASITGAIGSQSQTSTDDSLTITDANVFAVPRSGGFITLTLNGLTPNLPEQNGPPHEPATVDRVHWVVERNSDDVATGTVPGITPSAANPLTAKLAMTGIGSFNVIAYFDANGNGQYDPGEELKVFHVAEVGVTINDGTILANKNNWTINDNRGVVAFNSGDFNYHADPQQQSSAMSFDATVQMLGGGSDGMIGVSKIHLGWLNNGIGGSVVTNYLGGNSETWTVNHNFPLLDTGLDGAGGASDFLSTSTATPMGNDPSGGLDVQITAVDSPGRGFDDIFAANGAVSDTCRGTLSYACALSAFSDDYDAFYSPYEQVSWAVIFKFNRVANGPWTNGGASVTSKVTVPSNPTTTSDIKMVTSGALYNPSCVLRLH